MCCSISVTWAPVSVLVHVSCTYIDIWMWLKTFLKDFVSIHPTIQKHQLLKLHPSSQRAAERRVQKQRNPETRQPQFQQRLKASTKKTLKYKQRGNPATTRASL